MTCALLLTVDPPELLLEAPEVVELASAVRALEGRRVEESIAYILRFRLRRGGRLRRRSGAGRQDSVQAAQIAHGDDARPVFRALEALAIELLLEFPCVARVSLRHQNDRAFTKVIPVSKEIANSREGGGIEEPAPELFDESGRELVVGRRQADDASLEQGPQFRHA